MHILQVNLAILGWKSTETYVVCVKVFAGKCLSAHLPNMDGQL